MNKNIENEKIAQFNKIDYQTTNLKNYNNSLGIIGLVLAYLFCPAGIIVSAIALFKSKENKKNETISLIGLILSIVNTILLIIFIIFIPVYFNFFKNNFYDVSSYDYQYDNNYDGIPCVYINEHGESINNCGDDNYENESSLEDNINDSGLVYSRNKDDEYDVYFNVKKTNNYDVTGNFTVVGKDNQRYDFSDDFSITNIRVIMQNNNYIVLSDATYVIGRIIILDLNTKNSFEFSAYQESLIYWEGYYFFTKDDDTYIQRPFSTGNASSIAYINVAKGKNNQVKTLIKPEMYKDFHLESISDNILIYKQYDYKSDQGFNDRPDISIKTFDLSKL